MSWVSDPKQYAVLLFCMYVCVCVFGWFFFFFNCHISMYYTTCKNLNPFAIQQLLINFFSEIILQILRNSLIPLQSRFLSEIWDFLLLKFLAWLCFVLYFPKKCITCEKHPSKSFMSSEGCAVLETIVPRSCWNGNLCIFSIQTLILIRLDGEPDIRCGDKKLLLCRKLDLPS